MSSAVRILLVSHNFPPTAGPESSLVKLNTAWMVRVGFEVRVLTTTNSHALQAMDASLMRDLPADLVVVRVSSPEAQLTERFPKVGRWAAVMMGRKVLPEIFLPWVFPATKVGCRMVSEWNPQVIYSRAPKHVSNLAGWRLKQKTGLPWVAHFSDPWISGGLPHRLLQRWIGLPLERRLLRDADALVFVTRQARDRVLKPYPVSWRQRAHVISHGYEEAGCTKPAMERPPLAGPLKMIHAGSFYPGMRSPETLIDALRQMTGEHPLEGRLRITCVGEDGSDYRAKAEAAGLSEVLQFLPPVSFDECQGQISSCHLALVIDTPGYGGVFLPTKLFEAFALGRPVFGLTEPDSAMADILQQARLPWANVHDAAHIARVLSGILGEWEAGRWQALAERREVWDSYQIDRVNVPLAELLQGLARKAL